MPRRPRPPSLSGLDGWLQSPRRSLSQMHGSVGVIWFFTLDQPAGMAMVPGLRTLHAREGVQVLGIHSPDFARDADPRRVATAVAMAGMTWPVAMDHRRAVFSRWQADLPRRGWPWTVVLDREGRVAATLPGTDLEPITTTVDALLAH